MIQHTLINDAKINALPLSHRWLFINILLICGDYANDTITLTHRQINEILTTNEGAENALARLELFQLLTFEKLDFFRKEVNRIEENVKEENQNEVSSKSKSIDVISKKPNPNKELNLSIWEAYRNAYHSRYKVDPVRNASVNSKITQLANRLGAEAIEVIKFYLSHNDSFYLKNLHSIGLCLSNAESLHTQWKRNQPVTANDVKNFERKVNSIETQKALINGENF